MDMHKALNHSLGSLKGILFEAFKEVSPFAMNVPCAFLIVTRARAGVSFEDTKSLPLAHRASTYHGRDEDVSMGLVGINGMVIDQNDVAITIRDNDGREFYVGKPAVISMETHSELPSQEEGDLIAFNFCKSLTAFVTELPRLSNTFTGTE